MRNAPMFCYVDHHSIAFWSVCHDVCCSFVLFVNILLRDLEQSVAHATSTHNHTLNSYITGSAKVLAPQPCIQSQAVYGASFNGYTQYWNSTGTALEQHWNSTGTALGNVRLDTVLPLLNKFKVVLKADPAQSSLCFGKTASWRQELTKKYHPINGV